MVDATGSPAGLDLARQLCRPLGTLVLKSTCAAGADFNTAPFVVDELRVVGSRCGPMKPALELLAAGLDLSPLITATFPLAQARMLRSYHPHLSPLITATFPLAQVNPNPNPSPSPNPDPNLTLTLPLTSRPPSRWRRWTRPLP